MVGAGNPGNDNGAANRHRSPTKQARNGLGITRDKRLKGALDEQLGCSAADLAVTDDGGVPAEGPPRRPTGSAARPRA